MERELLYQGCRIHYQVYGQGKTIVLLHGFAEDHTIWAQQVAALQANYRLVVPDLPGSGRSGLLQEALEISLDCYADAIVALLRQETTAPCTLLGHSMGGYITLSIAERYPALLSGWGLVHSTALADSPEKQQNRRKGIELLQAYGAGAFIKNTTPPLFATPFKQQQADKITGLIAKGQSFSTKALQQYYFAMLHRPDRTPVLAGSKIPVLFIIGTEDVAVPLKEVLPQTYLPSIAHIHILDKVGHMGMWEAAEKVNTVIRNFVD